jgi:hypothetical protein
MCRWHFSYYACLYQHHLRPNLVQLWAALIIMALLVAHRFCWSAGSVCCAPRRGDPSAAIVGARRFRCGRNSHCEPILPHTATTGGSYATSATSTTFVPALTSSTAHRLVTGYSAANIAHASYAPTIIPSHSNRSRWALGRSLCDTRRQQDCCRTCHCASSAAAAAAAAAAKTNASRGHIAQAAPPKHIAPRATGVGHRGHTSARCHSRSTAVTLFASCAAVTHCATHALEPKVIVVLTTHCCIMLSSTRLCVCLCVFRGGGVQRLHASVPSL